MAGHQGGDTLDYTFTLVNTGNVTISAVSVGDDKCDGPPTIDSESVSVDGVLQVGETQIWSCTSVAVTQTEVDAGNVHNEATPTGTPAGGTLAAITGTTDTTIDRLPSWNVVKSTASVPTAAGDTLDYTFTLTNTGNVTISGVTLTDVKCDTAPSLDSESVSVDGVLQVDEVQVWSCTSVEVTQTEADAGKVDNGVTVSGTPAGGSLDNATDDLSTPMVPNPSWSIVKATASTPASEGDTLDYTFTLVNTGNVSVSAVSITDDKCATTPGLDSESLNSDSVLEVGETQVWSCTSIGVTQDEINAEQVVNTATASGTAAGGTLDNVSDEHTVAIIAAPSWQLTKATSSVPARAGDTLDYTFTLTNTGNVPVDPVAITDVKCDGTPAISSESITFDGALQVGETQVWSCTSIAVTQAEVDAGAVLNTATASGTPAAGSLDDLDATVSIPVTAAPAFALTKSTASAPTQAGQTLDYQFDVVNTGNVTIDAPSVTDPKCDGAPAITGESITVDGVLQVGETQVWTCTSVAVTQAEVDAGLVSNTGTLAGTPARGTLDPVEDTVATPIVPTPGWELTKATSSTPTAADDTLDYTFTLVNTGNVTIGAPSVTDPKCQAAPVIASESVTTDGLLQAGETQIWSCTSIAVTQAEIDSGQVINTATATGAPAGGVLPPTTDQLISPTVASPSWALTKTTASTPAEAGDTLEYHFALVNDGNVTISDVAVTDDKCATSPTIVTESMITNGLLDAGETQNWSCTSVAVTQAEVDAGTVPNTATATGTPAQETLDPVEASHSAPITAAPTWSLTKATASAPTQAGDTLDYTFTLTNTGNVTIESVVVSDPKCGAAPTVDSESLAVDSILAVDEVWTLSCTSVGVTQAEVDAGQVDNLALVVGTPARGLLANDTAATSTPIEPNPSVEMAKATAAFPGQAGDVVEYTFTVVNTGNVSITAPTITDDKCAAAPTLVSESATADGVLEAGETQIWSCTSVAVTQAEVDAGEVVNTATATGIPTGGTLAPVIDTHVSPIDATPGIEVVKSTTSTIYGAGDTADYTFTMVNTGNVTILNPDIDDPKCEATPALADESVTTDGRLEVGETQIWACTSRAATQAEVDAGQVPNTVAATGTPAGGVLAPDTDEHVIEVVPNPAWSFVKVATNSATQAGDTIDYLFTLANTGNVTIDDVAVSDVKCGSGPDLMAGDFGDDLVLGVGETWLMACTSIPVTQAEVDDAVVHNEATATATPAAGTLPGVTASTDTSVDPAPDFTMTKSTTSSIGSVGDQLEYNFTIVNTGNVTIGNVVIEDARCEATPVLVSESANTDGLLEVGETQIWSCLSEPLTQAEIDSGEIVNSATVTGDPAGGVLTPQTDNHVVPVIADPEIEVVKTTTSIPTQVGDTLDYVFTVVNTGNVTISGASVDDAKCAGDPSLDSELGAVNGILDVGETQLWSCTSIAVTQAEVDAGEVVNSVVVTGLPAGGDLPDGTDTVVTSVDASPSWSFTKTTGSTPQAAGETLDYVFTLTNTGNVSITDAGIDDAKCANDPTLDNESLLDDGVLAPGEVQEWSCTSVPVTQAEVDAGQVVNTALATRDPADGVLPESPAIETTTIAATPGMELIKSFVRFEDVDGDGRIDAGDQVHYAFTVTNTGNVTLSGLRIEDRRAAVSGGPVDLEPSEVDATTFTAVATLDVDDMDKGYFDNTATAVAAAPDGTEVADISDSSDPTDFGGTNGDGVPLVDGSGMPIDDGIDDNDPVRVELDAVSGLDLRKTGHVVDSNGNGVVDLGDHVEYQFVVTNTGTTTLTNVTIDDPKAPVEGGPIASMAPGESDSSTFAASYAITEGDLAGGATSNTATVEGVGADGIVVQDDSDDPTNPTDIDPDGDGNPDDPTVIETVAVDPVIGAAKELVAGPEQQFDGSSIMTFRIIVENLGDVALADIQVHEDLDATFPGATVEVLDLATTLGVCTPNSGFDGSSDQSLLAGSDVLAVDGRCVLDLRLAVTTTDSIEGSNQVVATAKTPSGTEITDVSTNGPSSDPDGDGSPDESQATGFVVVARALPDVNMGNQPGTTVTVDPLANDAPGVELDPTTVELFDPETNSWVDVLEVDGEGTWTVAGNGQVSFEPAEGFEGNPTPVDYRVRLVDSEQWVSSEIAIGYVDLEPTPTPTPRPKPKPVTVDEGDVPGAGPVPGVPRPTSPQPPPQPQPIEPDGPLAYTGSNSAQLTVIALAAILVGGALIVGVGRRDDE